MAWARPPGAPQLPSCPLEALEPREKEYTTISSIYGLPCGFGFCGAAGPALNNYYNKRPFYSGIWKHVVFGLSLGYVGFLLRELSREVANDKDAVMRQYIALHPEDFPPYRRVLIKDTIEKWEPSR